MAHWKYDENVEPFYFFLIIPSLSLSKYPWHVYLLSVPYWLWVSGGRALPAAVTALSLSFPLRGGLVTLLIELTPVHGLLG